MPRRQPGQHALREKRVRAFRTATRGVNRLNLLIVTGQLVHGTSVTVVSLVPRACFTSPPSPRPGAEGRRRSSSSACRARARRVRARGCVVGVIQRDRVGIVDLPTMRLRCCCDGSLTRRRVVQTAIPCRLGQRRGLAILQGSTLEKPSVGCVAGWNATRFSAVAPNSNDVSTSNALESSGCVRASPSLGLSERWVVEGSTSVRRGGSSVDGGCGTGIDHHRARTKTRTLLPSAPSTRGRGQVLLEVDRLAEQRGQARGRVSRRSPSCGRASSCSVP